MLVLQRHGVTASGVCRELPHRHCRKPLELIYPEIMLIGLGHAKPSTCSENTRRSPSTNRGSLNLWRTMCSVSLKFILFYYEGTNFLFVILFALPLFLSIYLSPDPIRNITIVETNWKIFMKLDMNIFPFEQH
jgi:hypothetical protein